jgi:hypothetical protein
MFVDYLRLRWELWRLERDHRNAITDVRRKIEEAKAKNSSEQEIALIGAKGPDADLRYEDDVRQVHTQYLISKAQRLVVPTPKLGDTDLWEKSPYTPQSHLTPRGMSELQSTIRAEEKARIELYLLWVPSIIGVIGALIGLAAILGKGK